MKKLLGSPILKAKRFVSRVVMLVRWSIRSLARPNQAGNRRRADVPSACYYLD